MKEPELKLPAAVTRLGAKLAAHPYLVALVALLVVAGIVGWLLWRRRRAGATTKAKTIGRGELVALWERFLSQLPPSMRATVADLPGAVVLGPAGSGASTVLARALEWRSQEMRGLDSLVDPSQPLQIYLGVDRVAQELASKLLDDVSAEARRAATTLWRKSFRSVAPPVLLVLDGSRLAELPPDDLHGLAERARGKIDWLAACHDEPIQVSLVLTHMDAIEGYRDLVGLLRKHGASIDLALPVAGAEASVRRVLDPYLVWLDTALVDGTIDAFARMVQFFQRSDAWLAPLVEVLRVLTTPSTLQTVPQLARLHLFSDEPEDAQAHYFDTPASPVISAARRARFRRQVAIVVGAAAIALAAIGTVFVYQYGEIHAARAALAAFERAAVQRSATSPALAPDPLPAFRDAVSRIHSVQHTRIPGFGRTFIAERARLLSDLRATIHDVWLRPAIDEASTKDPNRERLLYALGVEQVRKTGKLASLVAADPKSFATIVGVPQEGVTTYAELAEVPGWSPPAMPTTLAAGSRDDDPSVSLAAWAKYFNYCDGVFSGGQLGEEQLDELARRTKTFAEVLSYSQPYGSAYDVYEGLAEVDAMATERLFGARLSKLGALPWVNEHRAALTALVTMAGGAAEDFTLATHETLSRIIGNNAPILRASSASDPIEIALAGRQWSFSRTCWSNQLIEALIADHKRRGCCPFIDPDSAAGCLASPALTAAGDDEEEDGGDDEEIVSDDEDDDDASDETASTTDAVTSSRRYTTATFVEDVKPALVQFTSDAKLHTDLPAERLDYILNEAQLYAQGYRRALVARYRAYNPVDGRCSRRLAACAARMSYPSSTFTDFLQGVADAANVGPFDGQYLEPMATGLAAFAPIVTLMTPDKGAPSKNLAAYLDVMARLSRDLEPLRSTDAESGAVKAGVAVGEGSDSDDSGGGLDALLLPVGRVALPILAGDPDSYLAQVDSVLAKAGIGGALRVPFRAIVREVLRQGRTNVKNVLAQEWSDVRTGPLRPLARFPFERSAVDDAEPGSLTALQAPDGAFWQLVTGVFGDICVERKGTWSARGRLGNAGILPPDLLPTINRVAALSRLLWGADGKPQALVFYARPVPFASQDQAGRVVTNTFLRSSDNAVYGFNQTPAWQPFPIEWWNQGTSSVGAELERPTAGTSGGDKRYRTLEEAKSSWSFWRLLAHGTCGGNTYSWVFDSDDGSGPIVVQFSLRGDPWAALTGDSW